MSQRIQISCACGQKLSADANLAGKKGSCPACHTAIEIPVAPTRHAPPHHNGSTAPSDGEITCPHCATSLKVKDPALFGKCVPCPKCSRPFVVEWARELPSIEDNHLQIDPLLASLFDEEFGTPNRPEGEPTVPRTSSTDDALFNERLVLPTSPAQLSTSPQLKMGAPGGRVDIPRRDAVLTFICVWLALLTPVLIAATLVHKIFGALIACIGLAAAIGGGLFVHRNLNVRYEVVRVSGVEIVLRNQMFLGEKAVGRQKQVSLANYTTMAAYEGTSLGDHIAESAFALPRRFFWFAFGPLGLFFGGDVNAPEREPTYIQFEPSSENDSSAQIRFSDVRQMKRFANLIKQTTDVVVHYR